MITLPFGKKKKETKPSFEGEYGKIYPVLHLDLLLKRTSLN